MHRSRNRWLSGMSLQQKLPLLMSGFLVVVIAILSWASYKAVQGASLDVARQRLGAVTSQIAQALEQSAGNEKKAMRAIAADSAVRAFVLSSGARSKDAALDAIHTTGLRPELTVRAEILDSTGAPLLGFPAGPLERHQELDGDILKAAGAPDFAAVGRFRLLNDTFVTPSVAAIVDRNRAVGYVVRWRRPTGTAQAREQLMTLLGGDASLYVGTDRGDVWTDLVGAVPRPPAGLDLRPGRISEYVRPDGNAVLAGTHAVAGEPWTVLVEFRRDSVMAPAGAFLRRSMFIGFVVIVLATLVVWTLSRSITKPLAALTDAATAIAAGDYHRVDSNRSDEVGKLSQAFNTMIGEIESAQRGLEEKVHERTEQLRERNEELETFGHSISHDLRAPLRAMHGFSQALLEDYSASLDDVGRDYAQRVVAGSRKMDSLIQDLLAYSRVSRTEMPLAPVNLGDVANEALAQLEADVASSSATVNVEAPLPSVLAHRVALVQAVANLVSNGMKFVAPGRSPAITIRAEQLDGVTRVWVEDNGIGIDAAHHERVFGVFERLHQSERYPGTGIGLAVVRKSIERMGGRVGLFSSPGTGSRFWFELKSAGGES